MIKEYNIERFTALLDAYILGNIDQADTRELLSMLDDPAINNRLEQLVDSQLSSHFYDQDIELSAIHDRIVSKLQFTIADKKLPKIHFIQKTWIRYAVAACLILLAGLGGYRLFFQHNNSDQIAKTIKSADVKAPVTNRAIITLANGQTVYLDSSMNGKLASIGSNVKLIKLADGQIAYSGTSDKIEYNTISNPRGSNVIDMVFVDGSHVWLNAGSSITFPVPFDRNERKVKINGEAYFEIAHNASKPFRVVKNDMEVTVLGTHFNVNAYDDETEIKVTLLEGSVKINKGSNTGLLKPGQQADINDAINIKSDIDTEGVMAWKNGKFSFNHSDIKTVMRQIARWYDLDVEYTGPVTDDVFGGDIERDLPLSRTLDFLRKSQVHFEVEGKKVIVKR